MADPTTVDRLAPGDHVCWTFDDHERHLKALARFVRSGLNRNDQVLYFTDTFLPDAFLAALDAYGVAVAAPQRTGQLQVTIASESYLAGGAFDAERALRGWNKAIDEARGQGYAGLRVAADMGWTVRPVPGVDNLAWYEAQANRIFSGAEAIALCCYDRRLFTAAELDRVGAAHPGTARAGAGSVEEWTPLLRMRRSGPMLTLTGEADLSNREALSTVLAHLLADAGDHEGPVTIDVGGLTFVDIGTARLLAAAVQADPARVRLVGVGSPVADLLAVLDHDPVPLPVFDTDHV
ncbi:hypothetical protein Misp01_23040 [Microtetraspora sp. NBRC 13810]|uniref:MEDS domain-containing protein n=1 Tax=Microtetraspora sp. NBRC 13810 TaxID=3030990 RepID=UPI0024A12BB8|nr:MEDS domain-containing protein [Microtetraspora sp. NBRC 13810]GLW07174.1 hypothetical protein Misp01_23040 [Microtetraspora sp. NBRC 13810]